MEVLLRVVVGILTGCVGGFVYFLLLALWADKSDDPIKYGMIAFWTVPTVSLAAGVLGAFLWWYWRSM